MRATVETPIGRMMMASDGEGLTELCLEDWWWATDHQAVLDSNRESVGGAVKRNPVTIIVPCHRVVGSGRAFGGYGGRLDIKAELLELEGVDLARFDLPNL